jgi:hypothetical protein
MYDFQVFVSGHRADRELVPHEDGKKKSKTAQRNSSTSGISSRDSLRGDPRPNPTGIGSNQRAIIAIV